MIWIGAWSCQWAGLPVHIVSFCWDDSIIYKGLYEHIVGVYVQGAIAVVAVASSFLLPKRPVLALPCVSLVDDCPETACVGPISCWSQGLVPVYACGVGSCSDAESAHLEG